MPIGKGIIQGVYNSHATRRCRWSTAKPHEKSGGEQRPVQARMPIPLRHRGRGARRPRKGPGESKMIPIIRQQTKQRVSATDHDIWALQSFSVVLCIDWSRMGKTKEVATSSSKRDAKRVRNAGFCFHKSDERGHSKISIIALELGQQGSY